MKEKEPEYYIAKFMRTILDLVPEDSLLYIGDNIDIAEKAGDLANLKNYGINISEHYMGWYSRCYQLNSECKKYLREELSEDTCNYENYFCHWCIVYKNEMLVSVFDNFCAKILESLGLPNNLISECEENSEFFIDTVNEIVL